MPLVMRDGDSDFALRNVAGGVAAFDGESVYPAVAAAQTLRPQFRGQVAGDHPIRRGPVSPAPDRFVAAYVRDPAGDVGAATGIRGYNRYGDRPELVIGRPQFKGVHGEAADRWRQAVMFHKSTYLNQ